MPTHSNAQRRQVIGECCRRGRRIPGAQQAGNRGRTRRNGADHQPGWPHKTMRDRLHARPGVHLSWSTGAFLSRAKTSIAVHASIVAVPTVAQRARDHIAANTCSLAKRLIRGG